MVFNFLLYFLPVLMKLLMNLWVLCLFSYALQIHLLELLPIFAPVDTYHAKI